MNVPFFCLASLLNGTAYVSSDGFFLIILNERIVSFQFQSIREIKKKNFLKIKNMSNAINTETLSQFNICCNLFDVFQFLV